MNSCFFLKTATDIPREAVLFPRRFERSAISFALTTFRKVRPALTYSVCVKRKEPLATTCFITAPITINQICPIPHKLTNV